MDSLASFIASSSLLPFRLDVLPLVTGTPLGFTGLASAAMLWWGLAAAIPILLHFWFRRKRQEIPWAAMQFVLSAIEKQARRFRVEQWLLLLIRTAILAFLSFAVARPFLSNSIIPTGEISTPPKLLLLVLDRSLSMQQKMDNTTAFDMAIDRAKEHVTTANVGDGIALLTMEDPPQRIIEEATFDRAVATAEIDRLDASYRTASLGATLQEVLSILEINRKRHPRLSEATVVFVTDQARSTWERVQDPTIAAMLDKIRKEASIEIDSVADLTTDSRPNLAVGEITLIPGLVLVDQPITIQASIRNLGTSTAKDVPVQLVLNQQTLQSQSVTIAPSSQAVVTFSHRFGSTELQTLEVALPSDSLEPDNHRYFVVQPREKIRVYLVEDHRGESRFVRLALQPQESKASNWQTEVIDPNELDEISILPGDLIVLANVSRLTDGASKSIISAVRRGTGLLVFAGDRVDPANLSELFQPSGTPNAPPEAGLFPLRFTQPSALESYSLNSPKYDGPILRSFAGFPESGLITTPIFRYWKIEPLKNSPAQVDLAIGPTADPFLLRAKVGSGEAIVLLTSPTPDPATTGESSPWNAMAAWPSFLPLIRELFAHLASDRTATSELIVGETARGWLTAEELRSASGGAIDSILIQTPDQTKISSGLGPPAADGHRAWDWPGTEKPGVYSLTLTSQAGTNTPDAKPAVSVIDPAQDTQAASVDRGQSRFTVNVDLAESDLNTIDLGNLASAPPSNRSSTSTTAPTTTDSSATPIYPYLLGAVLFLLGTESLTAWWLGRKL